MSQASFAKRQREKDRREKAALKAARKAERREAEEEPVETLSPGQEEALLAALAALHAKFDNEEIDYEEFEEAKQQLTSQLQI